MYGFKVAFVRNRKFSLIGWLLQLTESLNILFTERRFYWVPYQHASFFCKKCSRWFDANDLSVKALTHREFADRYDLVDLYDFNTIIPPNARAWLDEQVGKAYSFPAIFRILRKFKRELFGKSVAPRVDGNQGFICTEIVLKAMKKSGYIIDSEVLEISSLYETKQIVKRFK